MELSGFQGKLLCYHLIYARPRRKKNKGSHACVCAGGGGGEGGREENMSHLPQSTFLNKYIWTFVLWRLTWVSAETLQVGRWSGEELPKFCSEEDKKCMVTSLFSFPGATEHMNIHAWSIILTTMHQAYSWNTTLKVKELRVSSSRERYMFNTGSTSPELACCRSYNPRCIIIWISVVLVL